MSNNASLIVFGPVPSRRLGQSLGINNIPPKICTYSCIYCQVGKTARMKLERSLFYKTSEVVDAVEKTVQNFRKKDELIDYLSFVPDGEPTLDLELGEKIEQLKRLGIKIAVISNASLIWREDVRKDLKKADWVSLKIDALSPEIWHKVDRPHPYLSLEKIKDGIKIFSQEYQGDLNMETMLVADVNDQESEMYKIARFIKELSIHRCYISIPTRPPTLKWVKAPGPEKIAMAHQIFSEYELPVECLLGFAEHSFGSTGDIERDLLSITSVHPMREQEIRSFLEREGEDWAVVTRLMEEKKLTKINYRNQSFFLRKISR